MRRELEEGLSIFPDGRMNPKGAAAYLGLSEKTLAIKRCQGSGPPFVKRGRIFYFRADLDEWLNGGRARSTAEASGRNDRASDDRPGKQATARHGAAAK